MPMVHTFFGRKTHDSSPPLQGSIPSPRAAPLLQRAPSRRIGQPHLAASHPPASLRPTEPAGAPSRLGVRRAPAREARSEPGRVATLTSPSTVTSLRNPVRAHGGAARARAGPRRRGRKSYVDLEARPEETRRRRRGRPAAVEANSLPPSRVSYCSCHHKRHDRA